MSMNVHKSNEAEALEELLTLKPGVAARSDTYANNVEDLAQETTSEDIFLDKLEEDFENYLFDTAYLSSEENKSDPLSDGLTYVSKELELGKGLDQNYEFDESEVLDKYLIDDREGQKDRAYPVEQLEKELSRRPTEVDMDRVEKLALQIEKLAQEEDLDTQTKYNKPSIWGGKYNEGSSETGKLNDNSDLK